MKTLLFSLVFCFSLLGVRGNTSLDSLQQIANNKGGREKLDILRQISGLKQRENSLEGTRDLEYEAKRQSNHLYLAVAYQHQVSYYAYKNLPDSSLYYINMGLKELSKIKNIEQENENDKKLYYRVVPLLGAEMALFYLKENKYNLALTAIEGLLKESEVGKTTVLESEAYFWMGITYQSLKKNKEALIYLEKSLLLYQQIPINYRLEDEFKFYESIMGTNIELREYDKAIALGDTVLHLIDEAFKLDANQDQYDAKQFSAFYNYAHLYVEKNELTKGREYLDKLDILLPKLDIPYHKVYHNIEADYFYKLKNYKLAKIHIDKARLIDYRSTILFDTASDLLKAKILYGGGEKDEAFQLLLHSYEVNDSINRINFSSQVAELETIYRVDKLKNEVELGMAKLQWMRIALVTIVLTIFLLLVIVYVVWLGKKSLRERNKQLHKSHSEIEEKNKKIEALKLEANSNRKKEDDPYQIIIEKLDAHMAETGDYKNQNITRDELALQIGTNRQYLINAIKEKNGQTFNEYLYSLRLKSAYNLLLKDKSKSITDIYLESGFTTQSVFNLEFKSAFGMTPSELRSAVGEESKESF